MLTEKEKEIAELIAEGRDYKRIAKILGVSVRTVNNHLDSIYRKLNITVSNKRTGLAVYVLLAKEEGKW